MTTKCIDSPVEASDTGLITLSDLAVSVSSGNVYQFRYVLMAVMNGGGGIRVDLDGGTASASWVEWGGTIVDLETVSLNNGQKANTLDSGLVSSTGCNDGIVTIEGVARFDSTGTLIPRFAVADSNNNGPTFVNRGSFGQVAQV